MRPNYQPPPLTREERHARRAMWHGGMMVAWGLWNLLYGQKNFQSASYSAFVVFPYWIWAFSTIALGITAITLSSNLRAMQRRIPGRLAVFCWLVLAGCFAIGNYQTTGVPIYTGLAINAWVSLVRE